MNGRSWTTEDDALLRAEYPSTSTTELARRIARSLSATYGRAQKLGLAKTDAYLASPESCRLRRGDNVGAAYRFAKGHEPANKGLRRPGFGPGRMKETQFTSGQKGWNWRPVGSERLVDGYRYTKVSDQRRVPWTVNWKPTHVLRWEAAHGAVPRGHALAFQNGNKSDVRLENLALVTRQELMRRNTVHNLPAPLPQTIMLLGALNRKINRRAKANEEQDRGSAQSPVRDHGSVGGSGEADGDRAREGHRRRGAGDRRLSEGRGAIPRSDRPEQRNGLHRAPRRGRGTDAATVGGRLTEVDATRRAAAQRSCSDCGAAISYQGRGRPRERCRPPCNTAAARRAS